MNDYEAGKRDAKNGKIRVGYKSIDYQMGYQAGSTDTDGTLIGIILGLILSLFYVLFKNDETKPLGYGLLWLVIYSFTSNITSLVNLITIIAAIVIDIIRGWKYTGEPETKKTKVFLVLEPIVLVFAFIVSFKYHPTFFLRALCFIPYFCFWVARYAKKLKLQGKLNKEGFSEVVKSTTKTVKTSANKLKETATTTASNIKDKAQPTIEKITKESPVVENTIESVEDKMKPTEIKTENSVFKYEKQTNTEAKETNKTEKTGFKYEKVK